MSDQPAASTFRLGDLLDHDELGLKLLSGGADARSRRVGGAHAIEIARPTTWLEPEWIMLTTGARLRRSASAQRELVGELATARPPPPRFAAGRAFPGAPRRPPPPARSPRPPPPPPPP